jgi:pilus assembly protein Flp/PilA
MLTYILNLIRDEEGAEMVEVALILALISIVSIGILTTLGVTVSGVYNTVNGAMGGS